MKLFKLIKKRRISRFLFKKYKKESTKEDKCDRKSNKNRDCT